MMYQVQFSEQELLFLMDKICERISRVLDVEEINILLRKIDKVLVGIVKAGMS